MLPHHLQRYYPFESHFFQLTDELRYHYIDEGKGESVVMIHGNPTWSFYYRDVVRALRGHYRCVVPDHIGMGFSDKPSDAVYRYTLKQRVDDLEAFLEHLGLTDNLTLIVHDWGGMIGMAYAHRHPERIKRLVILNTAAFHLPPGKSMPMLLSLVRDTPLGALAVIRLNAFARGAARLGCTKQPMPKDIQEAYCYPYDSPANRIGTLRFVQDIPLKQGDSGYDIVLEVGEHLTQFRNIPVLMCWGMKDFVFDEYFLAEWIRYLPHAEVHTFEDSGHYVLEDASEQIVPLIQSFLKNNPLQSS